MKHTLLEHESRLVMGRLPFTNERVLKIVKQETHERVVLGMDDGLPDKENVSVLIGPE